MDYRRIKKTVDHSIALLAICVSTTKCDIDESVRNIMAADHSHRMEKLSSFEISYFEQTIQMGFRQPLRAITSMEDYKSYPFRYQPLAAKLNLLKLLESTFTTEKKVNEVALIFSMYSTLSLKKFATFMGVEAVKASELLKLYSHYRNPQVDTNASFEALVFSKYNADLRTTLFTQEGEQLVLSQSEKTRETNQAAIFQGYSERLVVVCEGIKGI